MSYLSPAGSYRWVPWQAWHDNASASASCVLPTPPGPVIATRAVDSSTKSFPSSLASCGSRPTNQSFWAYGTRNSVALAVLPVSTHLTKQYGRAYLSQSPPLAALVLYSFPRRIETPWIRRKCQLKSTPYLLALLSGDPSSMLFAVAR
jgi:hypothetical protein